MKTPTAPFKFSKQGQQIFNGQTESAISCMTDWIERQQNTLDHVHNEQIEMINGVKTDVNGLGDAVRREMKDLSEEMRKKEIEFDARLDNAITKEDHKRIGERLEPLEKIRIILLFLIAVFVLISGTIMNSISNKLSDFEQLSKRVDSVSDRIDDVIKDINRKNINGRVEHPL